MTDQPIQHRSKQVTPPDRNGILEEETGNVVKCTWNGRANSGRVYISGCGYSKWTGFTLWWDFDWSALKDTGVDGLSGHITVTTEYDWFPPHKIEVNFTESKQKVETNIYIGSRDYICPLVFEYMLYPRLSSIEKMKVREDSYDEMFLPSDKNDTILVIDGKKLHVNKAFLFYHSDFFRALFSSNFKEGQMDEIPIRDVSYEDFGLLMSIVYLKTVYPNDNNVEKLLELADRFIIPAVVRLVEYYLLHNSKISNEKKIWLADAYGLTELLEKCLREYNTILKVKNLKTSGEYEKLSEKTKTKLCDRIIEFI